MNIDLILLFGGIVMVKSAFEPLSDLGVSVQQLSLTTHHLCAGAQFLQHLPILSHFQPPCNAVWISI